MRNRLLRAILLLSILASEPTAALAWGASGHAIVAEIAQRHLPPSTLRRLAALLGSNRSLASVAIWADTQAALRPATRRWHYVNIPVGSAVYDPARDCEDHADGDCLVAAVGRVQRTLAKRRRPAAERVDALRYLVHFIADAHQPLHCAERDGDAGGNRLAVQYFTVPHSLHQVWDFAMLEHVTFDLGEHVRVAMEWLAKQDAAALAKVTPLDWILETHRLAVTVAYDVPANLKLADGYHEKAMPA